MLNVDAVVVTFNRLKKLQHALECYDKQSVPFRRLIVVDNHSTDGTVEYLKEWESQKAAYEKHVIYLPSNVGGSGGFYEGEKYAMEHGADWVYISDDDAYPEAQLVEKFNAFYNEHKEEKISAICASVTYMNGEVIGSHRLHISVKDKKIEERQATIDEYKLPYFTFDSLSYVGVFLSAKAMEQVGLVNPQFFIYQDDAEHSIRLRKYGAMYCIPEMKVAHDTEILATITQEAMNRIMWKEYYLARNHTYMIAQHYPALKKKAIISILDSVRSHRKKTMTLADKMKIEGIWDAMHGRLGIHKVYHPGMDVTIKNAPYPGTWWQIMYWLLRVRRVICKR